MGRVSVQLKLGSKMNPLNAVFFEPSNTTVRNLEVYVYDVDGSKVLLKEQDNTVTANSICKARVIVQAVDNPDIIPVEFDIEVTAAGYIDSAPPVAKNDVKGADYRLSSYK